MGAVDVTVTMRLKRWMAPNYAIIETSPRPKQEGIQPLPTVPVTELGQAALDELAGAWLTDLYTKAGKQSPFERVVQSK